MQHNRFTLPQWFGVGTLGMVQRFRKDAIFGKVFISKTRWKPGLVTIVALVGKVIEGN